MLAAVAVSGEWVRPLIDAADIGLLAANSTPWTNTSTEIVPRTGFPNDVNTNGGDITSANLLPSANNTGNIGLEDQRWNHLYVQIANISELGGFSPIIVSTNMIASANISAPNYFGSGKFLTDIEANQSLFSNVSQNASFANVSKFSNNATFASAVNCNDIFGGNDPDFCNDATGNDNGGKWIVEDGNIYNLTGNTGLGTATPQAKLHVRNTSRISTAFDTINFREIIVADVIDVSTYTTILTITGSTVNDILTMNTVEIELKGNNDVSGNGALRSKWEFEINNGTINVKERERDRYSNFPQFQITTSGNSINLQAASKDQTENFKGFLHVTFDAAIGGGPNGETTTYTIT